MSGIERIAAERQRQIDASDERAQTSVISERFLRMSDLGCNPTPQDRIRELAKAGALIAAEIDRLERASGNTEKEGG